jgi:hypothetical protein
MAQPLLRNLVVQTRRREGEEERSRHEEMVIYRYGERVAFGAILVYGPISYVEGEPSRKKL